MQLLDNKKQITDICNKHEIEYLALFGSFARGEETPTSDVDLLVRFSNPNFGLMDHVKVQQMFEKLFGRQVDLVTERSVNKYVRPYIYKDLKTIYEG